MRRPTRQSVMFTATAAAAMSLSTLVCAAQMSAPDQAKRDGHTYTLAELKAEASRHTVNIYGP